MKTIEVSESALDTLKAMAEQDAKDAARYRWLRDASVVDLPNEDWWTSVLGDLAGENFDTAIDAAMQSK